LVLTTTRIQTDLSLLFPNGQTSNQQLLLDALREGPASRLILMGLEGDHIDVLAEVSKTLAGNLRKTGDFVFVNNGERTKVDNDEALLFQYRYLLSSRIGKHQFTVHGLRESFGNRIQELATPIGTLIKSKLPADPTGEFWAVTQSWLTDPRPQLHQGIWVAHDNSRALLIAETEIPGFALDKQREIQNRIKRVFEQTITENPRFSPIRLLMTGPAVFAVESEKTIRTESTWLTVIAVILVVAFLFANFRSLTPVVLSLLPLASGLMTSILTVNLTFGFIHGITIAFGATLIGIAVDYPIHLFSHLADGLTAEISVKDIWPTMFLGAGTTIMGYCALWLSGFPGLAQLGLFAIVGILVAALVTRWVLPSLIPQSFHVNDSYQPLIRFVHFLRRRRAIFPFLLFLPLTYLGVSNAPLWENDIANLSPIPRFEKELDRKLREELGAPSVRDVIVIKGITEEDVLRHSEELKKDLNHLVQQGAMGSYDIATRYLPSRKTQVFRQAELPQPDALKSNLQEALEGLPFKKGLFGPFLQDVARAQTQNLLTSKDFQGTSLGLKLRSLVFKQNGMWVSMVPLREVEDRKTIIQWNNNLGDPMVWYLDLKNESNKIISAYRDEALSLVGWGSLAICIFLAFRIRSLWLFSSVLLPIASSIVLVVALLHSLGERLSLFHLSSLLLVLGLGLDYALFFNRKPVDPAQHKQTISSIWICCMTTTLVLGILSLSQIPILRAIGLTVALGAIISFVLSAMLSRHDLTKI
jgi:predicted exporter